MFSLFSNYGLLITVLTAMLLTKLNQFLYSNPYGMPQNIINNEYKCWKWRNITISLIHSVISAFAGLLSLVFEPSLALDMINSYSEFAYLILCFSNGYFIYDMILSILNIRYPGRSEIIVHHFLTISSLTVSTVTKKFFGYCMTALVVETSNIFLHLRQLLQISGINTRSKTYRTNSVITIISLIVMRLFPISWIVFCLYMENDSMSPLIWFLSTVCAILILIVSIGITFRVIIKDFISIKRY